jgi:anaerobic selenocysteine-containing dehydrogenase
MDERTTWRTCPLCEAGCGLEITVRDGAVARIRGDRDDVFSHGFLCPKGPALKQLHEDPNRLRRPLVRRNGHHVEVDWTEAWHEVARVLTPIIDAHGRNAVALYLGNPSAHSLSAALYLRTLAHGLGTFNRFSASTVDQAPKQVAAGYMFGTPVSVPVPDLDRASYLLILGANPYVSNGSLCTAPDFPGRLEAIQARGGKVVVVDPRRSRTAESADEWIAVRPGTDAHLLAAMAHVLVTAGRADPGRHVAAVLNGLDELRAALVPFTPEAMAPVCGVDAATIRRVALELANASTAAVYGRIGTCTQAFGTTTSWLVDVLNVLTGNLDRPGGAMFARPATGNQTTRGAPGVGKGFRIGRGQSRVRQLPEVMGEYPAVALAEEIDTPGEDRVRGLVTVAGNPVLSTPDGARLDAALATLDGMVSLDCYLNETTRHADVILPPPSPLARSHFDMALLQFAVRNVANFSPPVLPPADGEPDEWEILVTLAEIARGVAPDDVDVAAVDERAAAGLLRSAVHDATSNVHGRDADELLAVASASGRHGPERLLDITLRTGPYGDGFGGDPDGLTLDRLLANPHGVDLGPLEPRLPDLLRTPSGRVELAPPELVADLARLAATTPPEPDEVVLVGRRTLRSNNSWMHNLAVLTKGRPQCTLQVHTTDAARLGLVDGAPARVASTVGTVEVPVEVTDGIRPGVVSLPHGWGHDVDGVALDVARARPGANFNLLAATTSFDPLSGNAVLTGIPVQVAPVHPSSTEPTRR